MLYYWDPNKSQGNIRKHGIAFENAVSVFDDPLHLSVPDYGGHSEQRWITVGFAGNGQFLVVVHTEILPDHSLRIISARKATKKEKRNYEERI